VFLFHAFAAVGVTCCAAIEGANLFFPEDMPDVIAEEALKLWGHLAASSAETLTLPVYLFWQSLISFGL